VTAVAPQVVSQDTVAVRFRWTFEKTAGDRLAPDGQSPTGGAMLEHSAGGWHATQVWTESGSQRRIVCPS
jgi:hypothetical protein